MPPGKFSAGSEKKKNRKDGDSSRNPPGESRYHWLKVYVFRFFTHKRPADLLTSGANRGFILVLSTLLCEHNVLVSWYIVLQKNVDVFESWYTIDLGNRLDNSK